MQAAAASPPGAHGAMFLPHFAGSCVPVDSHSLCAFAGLRNIVAKGDMLRAMIEGLDYQFLQLVRAYAAGLGIRPDRFVAIGGAINNPFWMQNKADVVGKPIEVPELDEAVPLGAAILAGIGTGVYRDEADAFQRVYRPGRTYEPNPQLVEKYAAWYDIWERLYPSLREVNTALSPQ